MAYSIRADKYISHITKREYPFDPRGPNGRASKAAAKAKMEAEEKAMTEASTQRHGRELSLRETLHGVSEPDTRTIRERVEAEVQHAKRPDEPANPYSARIVELERQLKHATRKQDRASIERKLAALQDASTAHDEKAATQKAFNEMMASAEVQKHVQHATTYLERLLLDPQSSEADIIAARNRLAKIKATGDVDAYRAEYKAAEATMKDALHQRQADMEAALQQIRAEFGVESGLGEATNNLTSAELLDATGTVPRE